MSRALLVIPARLASTRLPRKVLLRDSGKFLIEHVWERARAARGSPRVVIATDDPEVLAAARGFGAEARLTRADHPSGTDRVAEVAGALAEEGASFDLVVNVQGDEPELDPGLIDRLVELMERCEDPMGTLAEPLEDPADLQRQQVVKVVLDRQGRALYFSRAPIPFPAGSSPAGEASDSPALRHVGIYAFRPAFLQAFCQLPPAPLERREKLEQLRALWHGHAIRVAVVPPTGARGIDTPEDYARFLSRCGGAPPHRTG